MKKLGLYLVRTSVKLGWGFIPVTRRSRDEQLHNTSQ